MENHIFISYRPRNSPDNKVHGANMGPTWGRQEPGAPHVGHVSLAIWDAYYIFTSNDPLHNSIFNYHHNPHIASQYDPL